MQAKLNDIEVQEAREAQMEEEATAKQEAAAEAYAAAFNTADFDTAGAAKGLNDNAHGIDRFGYRVR